MADQGWMIDDGTCDACVDGECWACTKPVDFWCPEGRFQHCCCDEAYDLGPVEAADA
jgi:hypothetical protein